MDCTPPAANTSTHTYSLPMPPARDSRLNEEETVFVVLYPERYGDVEGQLATGGEPMDEGFFERWLKAKGGVDEAEACIRAHAQWRADYVPRGRILEVGTCSSSLDAQTTLSAHLVITLHCKNGAQAECWFSG